MSYKTEISGSKEHQVNGPDTIGDAWVHAINPVDLYKDARESANNWLPLGIGFVIDHPSALASPEFLEIAALDPIFRTARAVGDIAEGAVNVIQDGGNALKSGLATVKDVADFGIDVVTFQWTDAGKDVENFLEDAGDTVVHSVNAAVVDELEAVGKAVFRFL